MSESKHTPEPWEIDGPNLYIVNGKKSDAGYQSGCYLAKVFEDCIGGKKTGKANARLIAAAPDLLEACKDGVKFLDSLLAGNGMSETQLKMLSENRMAFRRILYNAISKTESR